MGLFSKKTRGRPAVETQGLRIEFEPDEEVWQFKDRDVEFVIYGATCPVPSPEQLAQVHADISRLHAEMLRKLVEGWKEWKGVRMNDGETFLVNITDLQSQGTFDVCWSGGKSWGDMGIDFAIKAHEIIDEFWGD